MMNLFLAMLIGNFERANLSSSVKQVKDKLESLGTPSNPITIKHQEKLNNQQNLVTILKPCSDFTQIDSVKSSKQKRGGRLRINLSTT